MTSKELSELKQVLVDYKIHLLKLIVEDNLNYHLVMEQITASTAEHINKLKHLENYTKALNALKQVIRYIKPDEVEEYLKSVIFDYTRILTDERQIQQLSKQYEQERVEKLLQEDLVAEIRSRRGLI